MKEILREPATRTPSRIGRQLKMVGLALLLISAMVAVSLVALAVPAAAMPSSASAMAIVVGGVDLTIYLLIGGIVFILVGVVVSRASMGAHPYVAGGSAILGIVLFVILAVGALLPAGPAPSNNNQSGIPQGDYTLLASVDTALGSSSAPGSPYSSTNTVVGGTTALWTTTEGTFDPTSNTFTDRVHVNSAIPVGALFMDNLAMSMKFTATLKNPYVAPGTGTAYTYTYGMKITSISRTILNQDGNPVNRTSQNVFYQDATSATSGGDWYLLYKNNAGTWMAACPEYRASLTLGASCGQVALGGESSVASTDTFYFYIVMNQIGFAGYTQPAVGSVLSIGFTFGAADGSLVSHAYTLNIVLNARDSTANT